MNFALYALLGDEAPIISNESLAEDLNTLFVKEQDFSLQFEKLPFSTTKTLALRWNSWLIRVSYEEGESVRKDSQEIQILQSNNNNALTNDVSQIERRIRIVFGNNDTLEHTNKIIYLIDFLKNIKGVLIFDPKQNSFI